MRRGTGRADQGGDDGLLPALDAGREELADQHVAVAVDDEAGQAVRLGVDQPAGGGGTRVPSSRRRAATALATRRAEEGLVDRLVRVEGPHPGRGSASRASRRRARATLRPGPRTSTVPPTPGSPSRRAIAREYTHGCRRSSGFRPAAVTTTSGMRPG